MSAYAVCSLLLKLCEHSETFTPEQRSAAGSAARRLFEFAWSSARDVWLVTRAIQCLCRTFDSDPQASATLLRHVLQPERLAQYGFEELPWLAREVKRLIPADAAFVGELYRAAFEYREQSQDPTAMGTSRILPLVSNRRQDYEHGLYVLGSAFPEFLAKGSACAVSALIAVIEVYVTDRHRAPSGEESFNFNGEDARLAEDYSAIWDQGGVYRHEEPIKMLEAFERHLERLAVRDDTATELREIVGVIVRENRRAVMWQKLLHCGARFPHTLGKQLLRGLVKGCVKKIRRPPSRCPASLALR